MLEPRIYSYEEFPASPKKTIGMKTLKTEPVKIVTCLDNIVYVEREGIQLRLQILMPTEDMEAFVINQMSKIKPRPILVFVPGSAWFPQALFMNVAQIAEMVKRGFLIAIAEYRPSTVAPFPAQILDIKAAVKYMRKNASQYAGDPDRIFVWGESSGGHTVSMIGVTGEDVFPCEDLPDTPGFVSGVIDFFGPSDLLKISDEPTTIDHVSVTSPEGSLLGGINILENPEKAIPASPITYISKEREIPPFLIVHGDKDRLVPFGQSVMLYEKLRDCGKIADFYKLEGADHGSGHFSSMELFDVVEAFIKNNI